MMHTSWEWPTTHAYVLSNGDKKIIFQWLHHIWTREYYSEIRSHLDQKRWEGYATVLLERLGTWTIENEKIFARATGYDDERDEIWQSLRESNGLIKQGYRFLLRDFSGYQYEYVDMSIDEIIQKAQTRYPDILQEYGSTQSWKWEESTFWGYISRNITPLGQRYFSSFVIFAFFFTPKVDISTPKEENITADLELNYRDEHLAEKLLDSPEKKILVLYGEWHIPGIYRNLRNVDPRWQLLETKEFRVFRK